MILALVASETDPTKARKGLVGLKKAIGRWTSNSQKHPLEYDETWKGLISNAYWVKNDPGADFGGPFYNGT